MSDKVSPARTDVEQGKAPFISNKIKNLVIIGLGTLSIGLLVGVIVLAVRNSSSSTSGTTFSTTKLYMTEGGGNGGSTGAFGNINKCKGKKAIIDNLSCLSNDIKEQSGANVTKGYQGSLNTTVLPILSPYFEAGLCPVNVHWHLGAEHYSYGQYDEFGKGPDDEMASKSDKQKADSYRRAASMSGDSNTPIATVREGFQCRHYDAADPKFTTKYDWKHCVNMKVGQTYEVHWPHSKAGACGEVDQYQTPFYDGVFCIDGKIAATHTDIGVQSQVFVIVNDEKYYYPNLIRGMIVDGSEFGSDMAYYTGSTTGTTRDNTICSGYTPITWQVDRKCHMISASTFDKMCADMLQQRDDMSDDLHAHGARELVDDAYAANNQQ